MKQEKKGLKFKIFEKEHVRQQMEKHKAYIENGFILSSQGENKNGVIKRKYIKN